MAWERQSGREPVAPAHDPGAGPFLRTRTAVPALPATFLRRGRLTRRLDAGPDTPLTLVSGAAGAGKTLLVADWAARARRPVAWLTNDAGHQGSGTFWAYVLEALRGAGEPVPPEVGAPACGDRVDPLFPSRLAGALCERDRPVTVVLDEYDRVTDPEISAQLEFVLRHAGAGLRLVLVTRNEPRLPLHRYRTSGRLTEIRNADLAFTPDEAAELLALHGLRLPRHATLGLVEHTRGWAAGLRLCALAARDSPDPERYLKEFEAGHSAVADFLLAEVLDRQDPGIRGLLLRVSVLDDFRPELADALTGRRDAESALAGLRRQNAFVEYRGAVSYRLHPLFAEILRAHLRERLPGLEAELHRRAAVWLRRHGRLTEALRHGAAAEDWEFTAGALLGDLAVGQLFTGLRSADLSALFARMPATATTPAAELVRAARGLAHSDLEGGLAHLRRAERALPADAPAATRMCGALLQALAARLTGSPERAATAAEAAGKLRGELPEGLLDEHPEVVALLRAHVGCVLLWAGRLDEARTELAAVAGGDERAATAPAREDALGHLALIDYLDGRPSAAEGRALAAMAVRRRFSLPGRSGSGLAPVVLAAVAVERDELDRAEALLDVPGGGEQAVRDPVCAGARAATTARLLLARGRARAAFDALRRPVPGVTVSPWLEAHRTVLTAAAHQAAGERGAACALLRRVPPGPAMCAVEAAGVQFAAGFPEAALRRLDALPARGDPGPAVRVRAALLRARAADAAGDAVAARRLVGHAVREARRERLRRPLLDTGPWVRPLLAPAPAPPLAAPVVPDLSPREREVLGGVARLMSYEEIGAELFISVNTVKTHLKNAYRKLSVNRRSDAVRRARELHLL
ncbi:LuxR C-terminal-related transcriptional regulator [Streptomyces sp. NPDC127020]|uniref:LuxR C-terminal-related transcriptional regulator n=1 Tax=Streptomyces sp. NPDC127020 TaxID=3347109 RepID=UPI00364D7504